MRPNEPAYTPKVEYQCDGSTTHCQGCKCHEARHAAEKTALSERVCEVTSQLARTTIAFTDSLKENKAMREALKGIASDVLAGYREGERPWQYLLTAKRVLTRQITNSSCSQEASAAGIDQYMAPKATSQKVAHEGPAADSTTVQATNCWHHNHTQPGCPDCQMSKAKAAAQGGSKDG